MAQYRIALRDGSTRLVEAPDGASDSEVIALASRASAPSQDREREERIKELANRDLYYDDPGLMDMLGEVPKGIARGAYGMAESAALGAATPLNEDTENVVRDAILSGGQGARDYLAPDKGLEDFIPGKFSEALGSFGALGLASLVPGVGLPLAAGMAVGAGAGEASERARAGGASEDERGSAAMMGSVVGASELFPITRMFSKLKGGAKAARDSKEIIRNALISGGEEAAQEAAATIAQNLIEQGVYNPEKEALDGAGEAAGYGGGVGGFVSLLLDWGMRGRTRGPAPTQTEDAEPLPPVVGPDGQMDMLGGPQEGPMPAQPQDQAETAQVQEMLDEEVELRALILDDAIELAGEDSPVDTILSAFSDELAAAGVKDVEPTAAERAQAAAAGTDKLDGMVALDDIKARTRIGAQEQLPQADIDDAAKAVADLKEVEAKRFPKKEAPAPDAAPVKTEAPAKVAPESALARPRPAQDPTQESFEGLGKKGEVADVPTPTPTKILTKEVMDEVGVPPKSPLRKKFVGLDGADPVVREQLVSASTKGNRVSQDAATNLTRFLDDVPAAQRDLLNPDTKTKPLQVATNVERKLTEKAIAGGDPAGVLRTLGVTGTALNNRVNSGQKVDLVSELQNLAKYKGDNPVLKERTLRINEFFARKASDIPLPIGMGTTNKTSTPAPRRSATETDTSSVPVVAKKPAPATPKTKVVEEEVTPVVAKKPAPPAPKAKVVEEEVTEDVAEEVTPAKKESPMEPRKKPERYMDSTGTTVTEDLEGQGRDELARITALLAGVPVSKTIPPARKTTAEVEREKAVRGSYVDRVQRKPNKGLTAKMLGQIDGLPPKFSMGLYREMLENRKPKPVPDNVIDLMVEEYELREADEAAKLASSKAVQEKANTGSDGTIGKITGNTDERLKLVTALQGTVSAKVSSALQEGDLPAALQTIANELTDPTLKRIAQKLADNTAGTKVTLVDGLPYAGFFDPKTNTVSLSTMGDMSAHTVMHEAVHAVLSASLANKSLPTTRQLEALYEATKDQLTGSYGATSLDEFVSEALSNTEFRGELNRITVKGSPLPVLQQFYRIATNVVRRIMGVPSLSLTADTTVLAKVEQVALEIMAPAPDVRVAPNLFMDGTYEGVSKVAEALGAVQKAVGRQMNKEGRTKWANESLQWIRNAKDGVGYVLPKLTGSLGLGDIAEATGFGGLGMDLHKAFNEMRGALDQADTVSRTAMNKVDKWAKKVGPEGTKTLNDLIYSTEYGSTIYQVDPKLTRAEAEKKYKNAKGENKLDSGNDLFAVWEAQQPLWKELGSNGGQDVYREMNRIYKLRFDAVLAHIDGTIDKAMKGSPTAAAKLKKSIQERLVKPGVLAVYFPLMRTGDYRLDFSYKEGVVGREPYVVQFFENYAERDAAEQALIGDPDVIQSSIETKDGKDKVRDFSNAPPTSFVAETLKILNDNLEGDSSGQIKEEITRLFIDSLPETAFARSLQRRKGVLGYESDAVEAMRKKSFDMGRQVVTLEYNARIRDIEAEIDAAKPPTAPDKASKWSGITPAFNTVRAELLTRAKFAREGAQNKQFEKAVKLVNQTAFVYTIGFNAASAVVNLSQIPLFVGPYLGAIYGYKNTRTAVRKAAGLVLGSKVGTDADSRLASALAKISPAYGIDAYYTISEDGTDFTVREDLELDAEMAKRLETLMPLVKLAKQRGQLTRSFIMDQLGLSEGGRARQGNFASRLSDTIAGISAMAFNQAERFNRQVTLVASYDLALAKLQGDAKNSTQSQRTAAAEEALRITQETNGGSVLETAPRIAQEGVGRVAAMYKSYGLSMYYAMFKSMKAAVDNAFPGDNVEMREARNVALKQLAGVHGSALFFSGIHGLPLYGAIQMVADLFFFEDDEDDFNTAVRKHIGEGWYKGAPTAAMGVDVGSRVRLTGLLLQENRYNSDASVEENIGFYLGGPALSVGKRLLRGVTDLREGNIERGVESLLPAGLANGLKTTFGRYKEDGGIYTRRQDPIYDDMSSGEMFAQFFGFAPAEYTRRQELNQRDKLVERTVTTDRSDLHKKYYIAQRVGDISGMREVAEEIREFNKKYPGKPQITAESIAKSMAQHARTSQTMHNGVTVSPLVRAMMEESWREEE